MVETTNDEDLVNMISMCCPFDVSEKQALLEAKTLSDEAGNIDFSYANGN